MAESKGNAMETKQTEKTLTKRQESALETQKKLLEAARQIVCERGIANVSVEEITQMCGVAKGTFYTYFQRKEDVIHALCSEMFAFIRDKAMTAEGGFLERLTFYMVSFTSCIEDSSLKLCQEWIRNTAEPGFSGDDRGTVKLKFDVESLKELLADGVRRGEVKPTVSIEQLALTLTEVLYGEMLCWATSDGAYGFAQRTREFCQRFLEPMLRDCLIQKPARRKNSVEKKNAVEMKNTNGRKTSVSRKQPAGKKTTISKNSKTKQKGR